MARSKVLRIILAVAGLALVGVATVVLSAPTREPSFVARFQGRIVSNESPFPGLGSGIKSDNYKFETPFDELSNAMHRELTSQGWRAEKVISISGKQRSVLPLGWSFTKGDEQFLILPSDSPVIVSYFYKPSWMETKIAAIRGWFS